MTWEWGWPIRFRLRRVPARGPRLGGWVGVWRRQQRQEHSCPPHLVNSVPFRELAQLRARNRMP